MLQRVLTDLDPGGEEARRWFADELSNPEYATGSNPFANVLQWLGDLISGVLTRLAGGTTGVSSWTGVAVAVGLLVAMLVLTARVRRRQGHGRSTGGSAVLGDLPASADELRALATRAFAAEDYRTAVLAWYRALARHTDDRALLVDAMSLTAHEVAAQLARVFPDHAAALRRGGDTFDVVLYGTATPSRGQAETMRDLEAAIRAATPVRIPELAGTPEPAR
jgi:hypothetical protein